MLVFLWLDQNLKGRSAAKKTINYGPIFQPNHVVGCDSTTDSVEYSPTVWIRTVLAGFGSNVAKKSNYDRVWQGQKLNLEHARVPTNVTVQRGIKFLLL